MLPRRSESSPEPDVDLEVGRPARNIDNRRATRMARHSRVNSSIMVSSRKLRPSCVRASGFRIETILEFLRDNEALLLP